MECGCGSAISGSIRGLNFTVLKAHALIHYCIPLDHFICLINVEYRVREKEYY